MALDFTNAHDFLHGTATVTLDYAATGVSSVTVEKALKQHAQLQDSQGTWVYSSTECAWFLPGADASIVVDPKQGDAIQEAGGTRWKILDASQEPLTEQWVCRCSKER